MSAHRLLLAAMLSWAPASLASAEPDAEARQPDRAVEEIEIVGESIVDEASAAAVSAATAADASGILLRLPGTAPASNGPITGQVQYRGMTGTRMNVSIDGMYINSGGPNWMDPPLHYAPRPLLASLELTRGIAPVSSGLETVGGTVVARTKTSRFTEGDAFEIHGDAELTTRSVDQSLSGAAIVTIANARHRLHAFTLSEKGGDREVPDGEIRSSEYERKNYGFGYGVRLGSHELSFDFRQSSTDDSGTPALPLDIRFFDSQLMRAEYSGRVGEVALAGRVFATRIDHAMDNFHLRPIAPVAAATRFVDAGSTGLGYAFSATMRALGGDLTLGVDGHVAEHDMEIFNPSAPAFFVRNFNDAEQRRHGVYAEWRGDIAPLWAVELGARYNRIDMDAGAVATSDVLPLPARNLRDAFNARDRDTRDGNLDWVAKLEHSASRYLTLSLGLARKSRSPYYIERFAWLPIEATAGLADGNNHIGDIDLDPEVSHELELGAEWRTPRFYLGPRVFVRYVDDYIQGTRVDATPGVIDSDLERVSNVNGDPTPLRYTNVDAKLYGLDMAFGIGLLPGLSLDGTISLIRGERRDISDDLYRIAPFSGSLVVSYRPTDRWAFELVGTFAAEQDHVSVTNDERASSGYGVLSASVRHTLREGFAIQVGIDNLLDQPYRQHLAGFNRVSGTDTALGERFQGEGRGVSVKIAYAF